MTSGGSASRGHNATPMEALRTVQSSLGVPDDAFTARTVVLVEGISDQRAV